MYEETRREREEGAWGGETWKFLVLFCQFIKIGRYLRREPKNSKNSHYCFSKQFQSNSQLSFALYDYSSTSLRLYQKEKSIYYKNLQYIFEPLMFRKKRNIDSCEAQWVYSIFVYKKMSGLEEGERRQGNCVRVCVLCMYVYMGRCVCVCVSVSACVCKLYFKPTM